MLVKELINQLSALSPDLEVGNYKWTEGRFEDYVRFIPYEFVQVDKDNKVTIF